MKIRKENVKRKSLYHGLIGFIMAIIMLFTGISGTISMSSSVAAKAASADPMPDLQSPSCILIEATTGTVLYEKNPDEKMKPASVTKIMTLLLVFESISSGQYGLDDVVTISEHAASMGGSQCFFEAGETQTVEDMIKCIIIASGNDAAVAMGEYTAGSEEAFVNKMNERAKELGMDNTHFENACGLDADGHETTARDISIMSRELTVNHPEIFDYSCIWMDSIIHKTARGESQFDLANTNKFLKQYTGATGLKTGFTNSAKYCMSATASRNGINLIAVIMGAETKEIRNSEAGRLLDYGFSVCSIYNDPDILSEDFLKIDKGEKKCVRIKSADSFSGILLSGESVDNIKKEIVVYGELAAPINKDDVLGCVKYSINGRSLGAVDIYADEDVRKLTFGLSMKKVLSMHFKCYKISGK
ncbi:MAG: D-alanyl-D-alanine carboxypeptidase family protein [Coprococcus sp.]